MLSATLQKMLLLAFLIKSWYDGRDKYIEEDNKEAYCFDSVHVKR